MIHILLVLFGVWWVIFGIVLCAQLLMMTVKAGKGIGLITAPALLVMAVLTINFACHMLHLPYGVIPRQKQIVNTINATLQIAIVPVILLKLYEIWAKKRTKLFLRPKDALPSE